MKHIDEYRDKKIVDNIIRAIRHISRKEVNLMEVCGGHTLSIQKFGIPWLLPENIHLLSGPGCPVCVTTMQYIDRAVAYSRLDNVIIATYGDLIRVPGSSSSLELERTRGRDIRIVFSTLKALEIAQKNPEKRVIFLGIGFETTAPSSAVALIEAKKQKIENFYLYSSHKIMPPALKALIHQGVKIDGYICPGHVSTITGSGIYIEIAEKLGFPCVISGFEPADILQAIYMLVKQIENNVSKVEIAYRRAVRPEGNVKAKEIMAQVFDLRDDYWRGLGVIPDSGLKPNKLYEKFDAEMMIQVEVEPTKDTPGCICGEILKGIKKPLDCKLFDKVCNPINPIGACMVSNEGACQIYYKYYRQKL